MLKRGNTWIWTNKCTTLELRDLIYMRRQWRNSSQSFEGKPLDETARENTLSRISDSDEYGLGVRVEFVCDSPDYCVFSNGLPILWHSTTTAKDAGWVSPLGGNGASYRPGLKACIEIIDSIVSWLNESELDG